MAGMDHIGTISVFGAFQLLAERDGAEATSWALGKVYCFQLANEGAEELRREMHVHYIRKSIELQH